MSKNLNVVPIKVKKRKKTATKCTNIIYNEIFT